MAEFGTSTIDVSFVVETLNLRDAHDFSPLDASLAALRAQSIDPARYEIIVVVDPVAEPALERHLADNWPGVRYLAAPGAHYYAMKNAGARAAHGRIVGYVDADCIVSPGWAAAMIEALDGVTSALCAVGRYDTHDSDTSAFAQAFLVSLFGHQCGRVPRDITSVAASNCALRRDELTAEPWREQPYFHGPDVEKASSIIARGGRIVAVPAAESRHDHEPGLAAQHGRGVYWGYCFLNLRRDGSNDVPYASLFRRLGPLAPLAVIPAKAAIDLRRLFQRRPDLELSPFQTVKVGALLMLNAMSCGTGAMRSYAGLPAPRTPQNTWFSGSSEPSATAS